MPGRLPRSTLSRGHPSTDRPAISKQYLVVARGRKGNATPTNEHVMPCTVRTGPVRNPRDARWFGQDLSRGDEGKTNESLGRLKIRPSGGVGKRMMDHGVFWSRTTRGDGLPAFLFRSTAPMGTLLWVHLGFVLGFLPRCLLESSSTRCTDSLRYCTMPSRSPRLDIRRASGLACDALRLSRQHQGAESRCDRR